METYKHTNDNTALNLAFHYARVAEEFGQVVIEEDTTAESIHPNLIRERYGC